LFGLSGDAEIVQNLDFLKHEMPFTMAFMTEVMRYRSAANMMYRSCAETVKYGDYIIPKGTTVRKI